jgi:tRNA (guanine-N7-)-methyltransferase
MTSPRSSALAATAPPDAASGERPFISRSKGLYGGDATIQRERHPDRMARGQHLLLPDGAALREWVADDGVPLEVEVGFGKGRFLQAYAEQTRGRMRILGFEVQRRFCELADARLSHARVEHVRLVQGDARPIIATSVPDARLSAVHVSFPDPWWKKRHHKRRVFSEELVEALAVKLRPGGAAMLRTDVAEYAAFVVDLFAADGRFEHTTFEKGLYPLTHREWRCEEFGLPVHRHRFILKGALET